ncbi:hypothetical protein [Holzapfeliella floricola]|uniref:Uncharacterized protein n=1 Tax=Holzapfeliella floricola DSM 23037 = JCM 16512 TaxID=1423744 RepID=A0A0R2DUB2_9LACO|nr:hypothetical protein [Holzapfeliella floricola]KRN04535.1 hypothetical protein FC86_GL000212 [Holzapfeliella floricola DSM 23037 = JCM 16512]
MKTIFKTFFTNYQIKDKKYIIAGVAILLVFGILDYLTAYSSTSIVMYCLGTYAITSGLIKKKSDYYQISKNYYLKNPLLILLSVIFLVSIPLYLLFAYQHLPLLSWRKILDLLFLLTWAIYCFLSAFSFGKN